MCVVTFDWKENDAHEKVRHFFDKRRLVWAVVEVTNACNFNCVWCYANTGYKEKMKREHMPKERFDALMNTLWDAGIRQITLSGGEPTVYPHLKHAIRSAKDYGFVVHMNS
jgi:molybdenum cofactor biosynthesis enzyme MoaA